MTYVRYIMVMLQKIVNYNVGGPSLLALNFYIIWIT